MDVEVKPQSFGASLVRPENLRPLRQAVSLPRLNLLARLLPLASVPTTPDYYPQRRLYDSLNLPPLDPQVDFFGSFRKTTAANSFGESSHSPNDTVDLAATRFVELGEFNFDTPPHDEPKSLDSDSFSAEEAPRSLQGFLGTVNWVTETGAGLVLLRHRLDRCRHRRPAPSLVAVATAATAPLLNTLQRQSLPLGRLLRIRRVDRSENLSRHYAPSVLNSEELYKFAWLAEGLAETPKDPQLWYRQRRPAQLRDYTLRRDEEL